MLIATGLGEKEILEELLKMGGDPNMVRFYTAERQCMYIHIMQYLHIHVLYV